MAQAFREGLRDAGYVEGRDIVIEWRSANGDYDRIPELAAELVRSKVDVFVANGTVATRAATHATSTIPIVMALAADSVGSGLVTNLAHPGGNITGNTIISPDLTAKRLQLLKEVVPRVTRVAVLWNPDTPYSQSLMEQLRSAGSSLSVELKFFRVRAVEEIDASLSHINRVHAQALYVIEAPVFETHRPALLKLASDARLPIAYWGRHWPDEGGLMSYGPSFSDLFRQSAGYVDRILKGAKPGDLPIAQPTKFELVVNLKTAKALGAPSLSRAYCALMR
jgi:putative ABC transport system substrate-binding protein